MKWTTVGTTHAILIGMPESITRCPHCDTEIYQPTWSNYEVEVKWDEDGKPYFERGLHSNALKNKHSGRRCSRILIERRRNESKSKI